MKENKKLNKMKARAKDICVGIIVGIVVGSIFTGMICQKMNQPKVTPDYIGGKLENIGELATQKLVYTSSLPMKEGSIPFITKKEFTMKYNATLVAGIDVSEMEIDVKDKKVVITVPHTEILDAAHVDPSSIKFIDEKKAILNWKNAEDTKEALEIAETDYENNSDINVEGLLNAGDENLENIIHDLLDDSVGDKEVEVRFKK